MSVSPNRLIRRSRLTFCPLTISGTPKSSMTYSALTCSRLAATLGSGTRYSREQLDYFAKVAASIMGIEAEHRVLGRDLGNENPPNNLLYEQTDGLNAVYNGPNSAVAALTPFLTSSTGPGYSLATALGNQGSVSLPVTGNPPAF